MLFSLVLYEIYGLMNRYLRSPFRLSSINSISKDVSIILTSPSSEKLASSKLCSFSQHSFVRFNIDRIFGSDDLSDEMKCASSSIIVDLRKRKSAFLYGYHLCKTLSENLNQNCLRNAFKIVIHGVFEDEELLVSVARSSGRCIHLIDCRSLDFGIVEPFANLFPADEAILTHLKFRPTSTIENHPVYWQLLQHQFSWSNVDLIELLCCALRKFDGDFFVYKLVLKRLYTILKYNPIERHHAATSFDFYTQLTNSFKHFYYDLDIVDMYFDLTVIMLQEEPLNHDRIKNISLCHLTCDFGPYAMECARRCVQELNLSVVNKMSVTKRIFYFHETSELNHRHRILEYRLGTIFASMQCMELFYRDPDSSPILSLLATLLCGDEKCKVQFRELGGASLLAKILRKHRQHGPIIEETFKLLNIAAAGRESNPVLLIKCQNLKDEILYNLQHFGNNKIVAEELCSFLVKLAKSSQYSQWLLDVDSIPYLRFMVSFHRENPSIESIGNQLIMILKQSTSNSDNSSSDLVEKERQRHSRQRRRELSKQSRLKSYRDRTRAPGRDRIRVNDEATPRSLQIRSPEEWRDKYQN